MIALRMMLLKRRALTPTLCFHLRQCYSPRDIPQLEVLKFDEDPSKYAKFMSTFEQTVDAANLTISKKLQYLVQHCKGEAKQLIDYCCLLNPEEGYAKALKLLKDNYVKTNLIACAYCEKLTKGPLIKSDNPKGLTNLAQLVEKSGVTLNCLNYQADLDNFNTIIAIVKRLPFALQTHWLRTVAEIEKRGSDAKFKTFVKFIKDEAEIANSRLLPRCIREAKEKVPRCSMRNQNKQNRLPQTLLVTTRANVPFARKVIKLKTVQSSQI